MRTHQQMCTAILEEEDEILEAHRKQIDDSMKLVKEVIRFCVYLSCFRCFDAPCSPCVCMCVCV